MRYSIVGSFFPAVEVNFDKADESVVTQSGGMAWMSAGVTMATDTRGGFMKGLKRTFGGESMFMVTYTAERPGTSVAFSSIVPGEVLSLDLSLSGPMICKKGSFLCGQPDVQIGIAFTQKVSTGLFGGEGFILEELSGSGMAFLEIEGNKVEKILAPGEVIKVDTGKVVAFEKGMVYEVERVKGFKNVMLSGSGLFFTKIQGPGRVIIQTQNFAAFTDHVARHAANYISRSAPNYQNQYQNQNNFNNINGYNSVLNKK